MTTLKDAQQGLARAMDDLEQYEVLVGSAGLTFQATRMLNGAASASTSRYNGRWMYCSQGTALGASNVVVHDGYVPATGIITAVHGWGVTISPADIIDMTGLFPSVPGTLGARTSYRDLVREALRFLVVPDYISVPIVAGAQEYALTQPWLDREARFTGELLDPPRAAGWPHMRTSRRWDVRVTAGLPTITFIDRGYEQANGLSFKVGVLRPGYSSVNGAESLTGPVAPTDVILPALQDIIDVGMWLAYRSLMVYAVGRPSGDWAEMMAAQEAKVLNLATFDRTRYEQQKAADATTATVRAAAATQGVA